MISIETMKFRTADMVGEEFPLVFWRGKGRIVASDDISLSLLDPRAPASTSPGTGSSPRGAGLLSNHTLTVDELGGGADAVGIVSLFAFLQADAVSVSTPTASSWSTSEGHAGAPVRRHVTTHLLGPVAPQDPRRLTPFSVAATGLRT